MDHMPVHHNIKMSHSTYQTWERCVKMRQPTYCYIMFGVFIYYIECVNGPMQSLEARILLAFSMTPSGYNDALRCTLRLNFRPHTTTKLTRGKHMVRLTLPCPLAWPLLTIRSSKKLTLTVRPRIIHRCFDLMLISQLVTPAWSEGHLQKSFV